MKLTKDHIDFENRCRSIIGLTLVKVEYTELQYEPTNPKPCYTTRFTNLDTVDFSIYFHTKTGSIIEFYWDGQFFQFGLGVKINQSSDFHEYQKWNVSNSDLLRKFINTQIVDVMLTWETVTTSDGWFSKSESFTYPQDVKISFSNKQNIFISASGFLNDKDNEVYGMLDNLTVTDNETLARQVKMIN